MFQLRQLRTFLAAAETLSVTQAARRVHLSQPAVTEQIQALEDDLGQRLFVRQRNALSLTEAGQRLARRARELLALADDTFQAVRGGTAATDTGHLSVAAPESLCTGLLAPLLALHAELRPGITVALQAKNSAATAHAVNEGEADLGLVHGWPVRDAQLQVEALARDEPLVLLPAGPPRAARTPVPAEALAAYPLVATTVAAATASTWKPWCRRRPCARACGPRPTVPLRCWRWWRRAWASRSCRRWPAVAAQRAAASSAGRWSRAAQACRCAC